MLEIMCHCKQPEEGELMIMRGFLSTKTIGFNGGKKMKDEDVRIGMKVQKKGHRTNVYTVIGKNVYKNKPFYVIKNIKNCIEEEIPPWGLEPYLDIEQTAEQLSKAIDNLKDTLSQQLQPLIDFVAKNKDTFEKFVEESKEEKLEKEIEEAFAECFEKASSYSLRTCFRAGFLAGRESK
jgi:hypothetical protein